MKNNARFRNCKLKPVTFKSNDVLTYEWLKQGHIKEADLESIVDKIRQGRKVKYTKQALDLSIEEHEHLLDNYEFGRFLLYQSPMCLY